MGVVGGAGGEGEGKGEGKRTQRGGKKVVGR